MTVRFKFREGNQFIAGLFAEMQDDFFAVKKYTPFGRRAVFPGQGTWNDILRQSLDAVIFEHLQYGSVFQVEFAVVSKFRQCIS